MWFYIPLSSNYKLSSLGRMWWVQLRVIYSYGLSNFFHAHLQNICHHFLSLPTASILSLRWLLLRYATELLISRFTYYGSRDGDGLKLRLDWCRGLQIKQKSCFQISHNYSSGYFWWNIFFLYIYILLFFLQQQISTVTGLVSHSLIFLSFGCRSWASSD